MVGQDENAGCLKTVLKSQNVRTDAIITASDRPTTTKTRIVSGQQQIVRIDREVKKAVSGALAEEVLATFSAALETADACILSDYAKGLLTPSICHQMVARARKQGKTLVVDPKGTRFQQVRRMYGDDAELYGKSRSRPMFPFRAMRTCLSRRTGCAPFLAQTTALLVTRGADGMTLVPEWAICHSRSGAGS